MISGNFNSIVEAYSKILQKEIFESNNHGVITTEEDAAYMEAVERGDMDIASKMVRDTAAKAFSNTKILDNDGKPKVMFHGTKRRFTKFAYLSEDDLGRERQTGAEQGFFFAPTYEEAQKFSSKKKFKYDWRKLFEGTCFKTENEFKSIQNVVYSNMISDILGWVPNIEAIKNKLGVKDDNNVNSILKEMYRVEDRMRESANKHYFENKPIVLECFLNIKNPAEYNGELIGVGIERQHLLLGARQYADGAIIYDADTGGYYGDEYVAFYPNQIKSADAVTYDNAGNIIPLSRRFDNGDDIRGAV